MSIELLPKELLAEVLSYLPVKSLMQLRCVCKSWNILLSHPKFIIKQSKKDKQILCMSRFDDYILPFPLKTLLTNPSEITYTGNYFPSKSNPIDPNYNYKFIGSCNGLCCFLLSFCFIKYPRSTWFQLWNPATNTLSKKFGERSHPMKNENTVANGDYPRCNGFSFGYDNSTDTFKVVYFRPNKLEIFTFGGFVWKIIQLPHLVPLEHLERVPSTRIYLNEDVYFNDTINLLARDIAEEQQIIVIISLNLSTNTYRRLLPPQDFVEVKKTIDLPTIHVLEDSLYFSHHHTQNTHFIIWKMTEFGIENSWTQFLKISYHDLDIRINYEYFPCSKKNYKYFLAPLRLCEIGIALVQAADQGGLQVILYHWSENRIEKFGIDYSTKWLFNQNHVESLAPTVSRPQSNFKHIRSY